jgi:hypothetical protein
MHRLGEEIANALNAGTFAFDERKPSSGPRVWQIIDEDKSKLLVQQHTQLGGTERDAHVLM